MLNEWYKENQNGIQSNEYVFNKNEHLKSQGRLVEFYKELEEDLKKEPTSDYDYDALNDKVVDARELVSMIVAQGKNGNQDVKEFADRIITLIYSHSHIK